MPGLFVILWFLFRNTLYLQSLPIQNLKYKVTNMEKYKDLYEAPAITVVNVKPEGVVCTSPGNAGTQNYTWNEEEEE